MEKLLLAAFLSSLAGFITAVLNIVKLVNEKENRTSEFRQQWTDSLRIATSTLAAKITELTAATEYQTRLAGIEKKLAARPGTGHEKRLEMVRSYLVRVGEDLPKHRHDQHHYFSLCKLHFKPDEEDFKPIEDIFLEVRKTNATIEKEHDPLKRRELRKKNYERSTKIVELTQSILKEVWDKVKEGEEAYKLTKRWSFRGGVITLFILLATGAFTFYTASQVAQHETVANAKTSERCWHVQNAGKQIIKLNACTGEMSKVNLSDIQHSTQHDK